MINLRSLWTSTTATDWILSICFEYELTLICRTENFYGTSMCTQCTDSAKCTRVIFIELGATWCRRCEEQTNVKLCIYCMWERHVDVGLRVVTPFGLAGGYKHFGGAFCPEHAGSLFLQCWYPPTSPHDVTCRGPSSTSSLLQEYKILYGQEFFRNLWHDQESLLGQ
jgi:hypothetical protein